MLEKTANPVIQMVDDTIGRLSAKKFETDPIVAPTYSAITSIVSSAYKRHGQIIEQAVIAALSETTHLRVWSEPSAYLMQRIGWRIRRLMRLGQV